MPYGDQALFVKASLIRELDGFKEVPIMEDYDLVKRLRKHGPPAIIPHALQTSGRRWQTVGFFRTTLTNQVASYRNGNRVDAPDADVRTMEPPFLFFIIAFAAPFRMLNEDQWAYMSETSYEI
ncbi:MAG: glycosyl transferase family 2 [Trebouxia sp. A1-2]|nr:MAG: glycosyl transferase family 2 [Trebouxia sp. A1-2]